jgi:hypothetical protein
MISITYALVALGLLCLVGTLLHRWRVRQIFMRGTGVLAQEVGTLQLALEDARAQKDRYFEKISEFEKQRDEWHQLYVDQSIGHGNAQNLMMDTIEQMGKVLSSKGIRFKIPRVLHEVRAEFSEKYEMPARSDELAQKPEPPPIAS